MMRIALLLVGVTLSSINLSAQTKPLMVVNSFTTAPGVELPYDMKLLQMQLVAELKVMLGKQFTIVAEKPETASGTSYTLDGEFTGWRAGNVAKRLVVGLGSGREATDLRFRITDHAGKGILDRRDTVRTNFYAQNNGSTGTLAHPIAQKLADRIKDVDFD